MITRNLHNYFMYNLYGSDTSVMHRSGTTSAALTSDNAYLRSNPDVSVTMKGYGARGGYVRTLRIGTGTTEPSFDDYELEQIIDAAPKSITAARKTSYENSYEIVTATFLNETDTDWVVTEVGEYLATDMSNETKALLLAREVFDPVTVKPGQTFSVSMKLF